MKKSSRFHIRVTSVSKRTDHFVIRGIPIENFKTQTVRKVIIAKAPSKILPMIPAVGQHWKIKGVATEREETRNGFRFIGVNVEASKATVTMPHTGEAFIDFISNSIDFKGIGTVKARELWNKFGTRIYKEIDSQNFDIFKPVLTPESIKELFAGWSKYANLKHLQWMADIGIRPDISSKLVQFHKENSVNAIKDNPYRLLSFGMSFKDLDSLAKEKFNISESSPRRLVAAVEQALNQWVGKGHTYAHRDDIFDDVVALLKDKETVNKAFDQAIEWGAFIVGEEGTYHPTGMLVIERVIAKRFKKLAKHEEWSFKHDDAYYQACSASEFPLTEKQGEAVYNALNYSISAVFGGAGTGKTTVIRSVVAGFEFLGYEIHQIALSGRAAKRMRESTGKPTKTIAAFLRDAPVEVENAVVIIDESSMVDAKTMYQLITHTHDSVRFVLVGDPDQLPPIGAGLVLHAIQGSEVIPQVELDIVKRQDAESGIPSYSRDIKNGIVPDQLSIGSVTFHQVPESEINDTVVKLYSESPETSQIVAATYKKANGGIYPLNKLCQSALNSESEDFRFQLYDEDYVLGLRVGDPILLTKNDIKLDVQNGSLGQLKSVSDGENSFGEIALDDGRDIQIDNDLLDYIQLAYAISLHKAQGSQFERVIIPIVHSLLLDRGWIYTAITRAEKNVHLVGSINLFKRYIRESSKAHLRKTYLTTLLKYSKTL